MLKSNLKTLNEENNYYKTRIMDNSSGRATNEEDFTVLTRQLAAVQD